MENERLESIIKELNEIRSRESEVLMEIEEIIRSGPPAPAITQAKRRTSAPIVGHTRVPARHQVTAVRHQPVGRTDVTRSPQVVETVNGIAKGIREFLKSQVNKHSNWPASSKWDPERSRYATVIQVDPTQIHVLTKTNITTCRAPHNVHSIVE
jgi:hypothetical protein